MSEAKYNTNLAAEFHVLLALHRLGADATLTVGNKKSVDIAVVQATGRSLTVDVKGLAGKTSGVVRDSLAVHFAELKNIRRIRRESI